MPRLDFRPSVRSRRAACCLVLLALAAGLLLLVLPAVAQEVAKSTPTVATQRAPVALSAGSPVLIRIFKEESQLEIWMQNGARFEFYATYPICFWSGTLGPKEFEGDHQAPEGFYTVGRQQLVLTGKHARSLDLGFPN